MAFDQTFAVHKYFPTPIPLAAPPRRDGAEAAERFLNYFSRNEKVARLNQCMSADFLTLIDFLERLRPEVSGRILAEPHGEAAIQIERFARGDCDKGQQRAVCALLHLNPIWIRWLADRVRMARFAASDPLGLGEPSGD